MKKKVVESLIVCVLLMSSITISMGAVSCLPYMNISCERFPVVEIEHNSLNSYFQTDSVRTNSQLKQPKKNDLKSMVTDTWIYNFAGLCSQVVCTLISKITFPHSQNDKIKELLPHLKKWDIICIKTTHRLSNYLIPGYFGHAAIYMGNNTFAHCDLKGARYSPIAELSDGDSYILLRPKKVSDEQENRMHLKLNELIGAKYDYNFNTNTTDRLICTELIYLTYNDYQWKTNKLLLWDTMSPDEIVLSSINNEKITIEYLLTEKGMVEHPSMDVVKKLFD